MKSKFSISKILMVVTLAQTLSTEARFFSKKDEEVKPNYLNIEQSATLTSAQEKVLKDLQIEMTSRFEEIDKLIAVGSTKEAFLKAKGILDDVRFKTGIDPKAKIQESFLVPTVFSETARELGDLNENQKLLVIRTISNFRGGLYLDIMNLSKRTTLLYLKAFEAELGKGGRLTDDDHKKIANDLIKASVMPMPVEDKKGNKIIVFEEDVANEDHTYIFNRELKMFLIENSNINMNESQFNEAKENFKKTLLTNSTILPKKKVEMDLAFECMSNASKIGYSDTRVYAQINCFKKYSDRAPNFSTCLKLANLIEYSDPRVSAQAFCASKFE